MVTLTVPQEGGSEDIATLREKVKQIVESEDVDLADFYSGKRQPTPEALEQIKAALVDSPVANTINWQEFIVEIHRKSDPRAAIAGDDTVNCMPFGDGKSTVYTFNLNTAQLTLQARNGSEQYRTVAQSVLTKDRDVRRNVPDILRDLNKGQTYMPDILPQEILSNASSFIAADNIEVAPNWQGDFEYVIEALYGDFFQRYLQTYGEEQRIDGRKVIIGMGYADAMGYLPTEGNTYIPQAPVSYSDKTGQEVFVLDIQNRLPSTAFANNVEQSGTKITILGEAPTSPQISFLTYEDSLAVGYIEGKSYADNPQMIQNLHNMENALIAMQINNIDKTRPHMSLKYQDGDGNIRGYMLAYEGRMGSSYEGYYEDDQDEGQKKEGERIVYIADLASDKESQTAGGRLINSFLDLYQKNYLNKGDLIPLYMEARETTSYRIIQRQLDKIGTRLGIEFVLEELGGYQEGQDTMHPILLKPKKV